jgi:hypothetical protein
MIVPTANYPTSRDYHQLWKLTHTAAIVCIVDCDPGKSDCRDIARTAHSPDDLPQLVQIGSRGACYVWAETIEDFIAQCQQCNLEWLVPTMWDHAWSYGKPDETDITDESCLPHNAILLPGASPPAPEPGLVEELVDFLTPTREQAGAISFEAFVKLRHAAILLQQQAARIAELEDAAPASER